MKIHNFTSDNAQIEAIIHKIQRSVLQILKTKPSVTIAVSGGKSPIPLFESLSNTTLPWHKINITLVDERIIEADHPDSNEYLVRNYLLKNYAITAQFIGIIPAIKKLANELYIDIAILGMGEDGHTASIFADCNELKDATDLNNQHGYIITHPRYAKYDRISMTLASIVKIPTLILSINGNTKLNILKEAERNKDYPMHYVLDARNDLEVYYFE